MTYILFVLSIQLATYKHFYDKTGLILVCVCVCVCVLTDKHPNVTVSSMSYLHWLIWL